MFRKTFVFAATAAILTTSAITAQAQSTQPQTPPASPAAPARKAPAAPSAPVNLNTATAVELETLPGVGAAMSARIIEYRQKNGGFKKIEDLMNVKGVAEKTFLRLKPMITVAPPKTTER